MFFIISGSFLQSNLCNVNRGQSLSNNFYFVGKILGQICNFREKKNAFMMTNSILFLFWKCDQNANLLIFSTRLLGDFKFYRTMPRFLLLLAHSLITYLEIVLVFHQLDEW